jgi:hypothetical protein
LTSLESFYEFALFREYELVERRNFSIEKAMRYIVH